MKLEKKDIPRLVAFLSMTGRNRENGEAWAHALYDLQESVNRVFEILIPEALEGGEAGRKKEEILWDIREEFRHIEYHMQDVDGR